MNKDNCFKFGTVSRLHSFKGEVAVYLTVDHPEEFSALESVYVDINNKLVPFFITSYRIIPKGFALMKFRDITTEEAAKGLLQKELFLPYDSLPELDEAHFYFYEIEGYKVVDKERGEIGVAGEFMDLANNPVLQIIKGEKEILFPLNFDFEPKVDRENRVLYIATPEGLIDLYLDE